MVYRQHQVQGAQRGECEGEGEKAGHVMWKNTVCSKTQKAPDVTGRWMVRRVS